MEDILIECSPGISGDMLLGAFHDLGVPKTVIEKPLASLALENSYSLNFSESKNCSIRGIKVEVEKIAPPIDAFFDKISVITEGEN